MPTSVLAPKLSASINVGAMLAFQTRKARPSKSTTSSNSNTQSTTSKKDNNNNNNKQHNDLPDVPLVVLAERCRLRHWSAAPAQLSAHSTDSEGGGGAAADGGG